MIFLASDHAGFELKKEIISFLKNSKIKYKDMGPYIYDSQDDYPDYIIPAAQKVAKNPQKHKAIILGMSGQGEAIAANKVKGIRAIVYYGGPKEILVLSRIHNNANVLSIGARFLSKKQVKEIIKLWLKTDFPKEKRHLRRINKISNYELAR